MKTWLEQLPTWAVGIAIVLTAMACHACLIAGGMVLHNSEWATFLLVADAYRDGYRSALPFQNDYGGLTITALRALFTSVWDHFPPGPWHHERGHMVFSYLICPPLVALSAYAMLLRYFSRATAVVLGLLCAVGLQAWARIYGNEFYPLMLICGFLFFALAAGTPYAFLSLPRTRLFMMGILGGHALYATRASQLFLAAVFVPWRDVFHAARTLKGKLVTLGWLLFFSGFFLELFGRNVGVILGHTIKMDGEPNIKAGMAVLCCSWFWPRRHQYLCKNTLSRCALLLGGLFVGLLPEILHWLSRGHLWTPRDFATYDFPQFMGIVGKLPQSFRSLVSGLQPFRAFEFADTGLGQHLCVVLSLFGFALMIRKAAKSRKFDAFLALAALNLYTYCRISTHFTEIAPARYLLPMTPAVIAALALLLEDAWSSRRRWAAPAMLGLLTLFAGHHFFSRQRLAAEIKRTHYVEDLHQIIETFRAANVDIVISNDFWYSNNLFVISHGTPRFWATWHNWGPLETKEKAEKTKRAGILLEKKRDLPYPRVHADLPTQRWRLTPLTVIGDHELYVGDAE